MGAASNTFLMLYAFHHVRDSTGLLLAQGHVSLTADVVLFVRSSLYKSHFLKGTVQPNLREVRLKSISTRCFVRLLGTIASSGYLWRLLAVAACPGCFLCQLHVAASVPH